jgi:fibronectin-binding autotransporter adhesin
MRVRIAPLAAAVVIVSATIAGSPAVAATCMNTLVANDSGDAAVATSGQIRTAISEVCNGGTIIVVPGLIITLSQGQLVIPAGKSITIKGSATIDAAGASRVIWVQTGATLTLKKIVVRGGSDAGINNEGEVTIQNGRITANGRAGVRNLGSVTLTKRARVSGNQGTGVLNDIDFSVFPERVGRLTLEDSSRISGNTGLLIFGSIRGGGIVNWGLTTVNDSSVVSGNIAGFGGGVDNIAAAVESSGLVVLNGHGSISGNVATVTGRGGGVYNEFGFGGTAMVVLNDSSTVAHNEGGGLAGRGSMILNDFSTVSNNDFGIDNERGEVVLNDSSRISANDGGGVSVFGTGVTLNDQSSVTRNGSGGIGALEAFVLLNDDSSVTQNQNSGVTVLFGSVIMNGATSIRENATAGNGGGIEIESCCGVIMNGTSTIAENQASLGGGIFMLGDEVSPGAPPTISVILNDAATITRNTATGGQGGGVYNDGGSVTLNDASSITGNIPDNCYPPGTC